MSIFDWLWEPSANPDLIGRVKVTAEDVDPEAAKKLEEKRRKARDYIERKGIRIPKLYGVKTEDA